VKMQGWVLLWGQVILITLSSHCAAQVVPDQTLPMGERSRVSGDRDAQIDGGAVRGNNLFHSFQEFSIPTGGSTSFNNASDIRNIITRVTGNNISDIDGIIRANGTANLFLINPNGILFGANARLEIGGSFLASTANSLKFADGFAFSATSPQSSPLLTVSAPIGLQYGDRFRAVRSRGAILEVPNGQTLNLTGGNVAIKGGQLLAPGRRVELAGVAAAGEVGLRQQGQDWRLSVPDGLRRANVAIGNDAEVNVGSDGGGSIAITARNLLGTGSGTRLRAGIAAGLGTVEAQGGDIDINATETINLNGMSIFNDVLGGGTGSAGNINITTGNLFLTNGAQVGASTFGQGNAGSVTIRARDAVSFDGIDNNGFGSAVFSSVESGGIGQGGNITITAGTLFLTNGGAVDASTVGQGNAGSITIRARDAVSFDGVGTDKFNRFTSGAFSTVESESIGQGGNISINTGILSLTSGALVIASTKGQGNAGSITIRARDVVSFDGVGSNGDISGADSTVESGGIGQGGTIAINTDRLSITNGARLTASSQGRGAAGDLEVTARQLRLDNRGSIQAQTTSGQGGDITLQVLDFLLLRRDSLISTTAGTAQAGGNGGDITFNGGFIVAVPQENSNIEANAFSGRGGNVRITTQGLFGIESRDRITDGLSSITASSQSGISGTIALNTPDVDPIRGIAVLPTEIIDTNALIASSCVERRDRPGRFVITGTGGLAPQPDDLANSAFPTYDLMPQPSAPDSTSVIEADRIERTATGEIVLGRSCE
jgi:filamentous hemagglutinin family protein